MNKQYLKPGDVAYDQDLNQVWIVGKTAPGPNTYQLPRGYFCVQRIDGSLHTVHGRHLHRDLAKVTAWKAALTTYEDTLREQRRLIDEATRKIEAEIKAAGGQTVIEARNDLDATARDLWADNPYQ